MIRFIYFSVVFALLYWFVGLLIRKYMAFRNDNKTIEDEKRDENIRQLEQAFKSDEAE
tara:strand:- start:622 stop:795 length:174 start_codon:yes stop_codon:yes gene_type:complete